MAGKEIFEAAGFSFPTQEQADEALEEEKKIYYIRSRLSKSDTQSMLVIYNKMIKGSVLKTPVGMTFLKELHDKLMADPSIPAQQIDSIPFGASYLEEASPDGRGVIISKKNEELDDQRRQLGFLRLLVCALAAAVIAMFAITMKSDNPNILNYETAIQNKYAAWEEELREREKKVREKELSLEME